MPSTKTTASDADHDGHFAEACGGTADDCNDLNPNVYPAHPELCDGVDNNCDGLVDEGVWGNGPILSLPAGVGGSAKYPVFDPGPAIQNRVGGPVIARMADGTFWVAAARGSGAPATSTSLTVWRLDAKLKVIEGPTEVLPASEAGTGKTAIVHPSIATDGADSVLLGATSMDDICGQGNLRSRFGLGKSPAALKDAAVAQLQFGAYCYAWPSIPDVTRPAAAWNGSSWLMAWTDAHDGTQRAYVAAMASSGEQPSVRTMLADPTEAAVQPTLPFALAQLALGPTSALVSWSAPGSSTTRHVLFDRTLSTVLAGPIEQAALTATGSVHVGSSYIVGLALADAQVALSRLDAKTGAVLKITPILPTQTPANVRLAAVRGGVLATFAMGTSVGYFWEPEDLASPPTITEIPMGVPVSEANAAVVSDNEAVITWSNGTTVQLTRLGCGG